MATNCERGEITDISPFIANNKNEDAVQFSHIASSACTLSN